MKKKEQCIEHLGKTINNKENTVENIFPKSINNNTMKIKTLQEILKAKKMKIESL